MTRSSVALAAPAETPRALRLGFNGALWIGLLLTALTFSLALTGSALAPADPLQENFALKVGQTFVRPPLAPGQNPDFPLGTDEYGRDLLSRLLWAIRPTLTLTLVVATLRLILGLLIGISAGWSTGPLSRALEWATAMALSAPVLFVALGVIAAAGQRWGVGAFILGLALTGWAETARTVREQTRLIKGQRYVESAQALGASGAQIILRHVLPHLLPLAWVLLALEASGALLLTATLGFLGYFVNSVWIPLGDYTGIRASGYPDLGQMLAYSPSQTWSSLSAGTVVLLIVLGLNLLGMGLREALRPERRRAHRWLGPLEAVRGALEDRFFMTEWRRVLPLSVAASLLLGAMFGGGWWLYMQTARAEAFSKAIQIPGGHQWASSQHDAQGTLWTAEDGPAQAHLLWTFEDGAPLSGPVVAADGTLYVITAKDDGTLYALSPQGQTLWQARLPFEAGLIGFAPGLNEVRPGLDTRALAAPALNSRGDVIVAGQGGQLAIFTAQGRPVWHSPAQSESLLLVSPLVGPDDTIYVATEADLFAFAPDGPLRLTAPLPTYSYTQPTLRLSANGRYLFLQDVAVDARMGEAVLSAKNSIEIFITGADGKTYVQTQSALDEWTINDTSAIVTSRTRLDTRSLGLGFRPPADAGVLPDGRSWIWFTAFFGAPKLVWTEIGSSVFTSIDMPLSDSKLLAIDRGAVAYACGRRFTASDPFASGEPELLCQAWRADGENLWEITLPDQLNPRAAQPPLVSGGALGNRCLYVGLGNHRLYAIGDAAADN